MAQGDVIKEFLVGLGFQVNQETWRKWNGALEEATKRVALFGAAATATAVEVEEFVNRLSQKMADLYYASERAGAGAQNLDALRYAAQGIGVGADEATAAVTGLANKLRENPGYEGFLNSLGIQTRDANHHLLDTTKIFDELLHTLQKLGGTANPQAVALGNMFGISPDQLQLYLDHLPEFDRRLADLAATMGNAGVKEDELAQKSREFQNDLSLLKLEITAFGERVEADIIDPVDKAVVALTKLAHEFNQLNDESGGVLGVGVAAGTTGAATMAGGWLIKRLLGIGSAVREIAAAETAVAAAAPAMTTALGVAGTAGAGAFSWLTSLVALLGADFFVNWFANKQIAQSSGGEIVGVDPITGMPMFANPADASKYGIGGGGGGDKANKTGFQLKDYFVSQGWSENAAAGIVANLQRESSFNFQAQNAGHYGVAQWDAARQDEYAKLFGVRMQDDPNRVKNQLAFFQYELTRGNDKGAREAGDLLRDPLRSGRDDAMIVGNKFERFGGDLGEALARGRLGEAYGQQGPAQINQTNHIAVTGVTNPDAAAAAVAKETNRGLEDAARNLNTTMSGFGGRDVGSVPLPIGLVLNLAGLTANQNAYPRRLIGTIVPQLTIREDHDDELTITTHPVELGVISDHAFKQPSVVVARYGWSNASAAAAGNPNYINNYYNALYTLQVNRSVFTLITGKKTYPNMMVASLRTHTDDEAATTLFADCRFQQVIVAQTQIVSVGSAVNMTNPASNAPTLSGGSVQLGLAPTFNPGAYALAVPAL